MTIKTRGRHPLTKGEKLRALAACIETPEDLHQALEDFEPAERDTIVGNLKPYLRFDPQA